jgi:hypothetical protein
MSLSRRRYRLLKFSQFPQSYRHNHSAPLLLTANFTTTSQPSRRPANSFAVAQPQLKERLVKRFTPFTALSVPQSHRHNHIAMCHLSRPACRSTSYRPKRRPVRSEAICVLITIALSHADKRATALVAMGLSHPRSSRSPIRPKEPAKSKRRRPRWR